jgi:hypothetical protein
MRLDQGAEAILEAAERWPQTQIIQLYTAEFWLFGQTNGARENAAAYFQRITADKLHTARPRVGELTATRGAADRAGLSWPIADNSGFTLSIVSRQGIGSLPFPTLAILRTMNDRYDDDLVTIFAHLVDDDIRPFEKFTRSVNEAWTPHMRKLWGGESNDFLLDAHDHLYRGTGTV